MLLLARAGQKFYLSILFTRTLIVEFAYVPIGAQNSVIHRAWDFIHAL